MLFGDSDILHLSSSVKMETCEASAILRQFRLLKDGHESAEDNELKELNRRLIILPIASAECERGFSFMNLTHTSQRNALEVESLRNLLFIKLNGPPLEQFKPERYVCMWLKEDHHSATDKPSGRSGQISSLQPHFKFFQ